MFQSEMALHFNQILDCDNITLISFDINAAQKFGPFGFLSSFRHRHIIR